MRKKILLPFLASCLLGLTGLSAFAEDVRVDTDFVSDAFMDDTEVDALFGELPHYLDLGSFLLNRLNHLSLPIYKKTYMIAEYSDGTYMKTRYPLAYLEQKIRRILDVSEGDWSVYIKDLSRDQTVSINDHAMQSASLIKLYIAGVVLERIEDGTLKETDTIRSALRDMIVFSDNESSNVLVRSLYSDEAGETFQDGLDLVNDFAVRYGCLNTKQVNGIADPALWLHEGEINTTSAADCGRLLEYIYDGELVSHYTSYRFENLLNNQEVNYKIPAALPSGTHISHKTGETSDTENDAAIIYTTNGDYIFCIMSTELYDTGSAVDIIHCVTSLVHSWFTTTDEVLDEEELSHLLTPAEGLE